MSSRKLGGKKSSKADMLGIGGSRDTIAAAQLKRKEKENRTASLAQIPFPAPNAGASTSNPALGSNPMANNQSGMPNQGFNDATGPPSQYNGLSTHSGMPSMEDPETEPEDNEQSTTRPSTPISNEEYQQLAGRFALPRPGTPTPPVTPELPGAPAPTNPARGGVPLTRKKANVEIPADMLSAFIAKNDQPSKPLSNTSNVNAAPSMAGEARFPGAMAPNVPAATSQGNTSNSMGMASHEVPATAFTSAAVSIPPSNGVSFFNQGNSMNSSGGRPFPVASSEVDMDMQDTPQKNSGSSLLSRMGPPVSAFASSTPELAKPQPAVSSLLSRMGPQVPSVTPPAANFVNPQPTVSSLLSRMGPQVPSSAPPAVNFVNLGSSSASSGYASTNSSNAFGSSNSTSNPSLSYQTSGFPTRATSFVNPGTNNAFSGTSPLNAFSGLGQKYEAPAAPNPILAEGPSNPASYGWNGNSSSSSDGFASAFLCNSPAVPSSNNVQSSASTSRFTLPTDFSFANSPSNGSFGSNHNTSSSHPSNLNANSANQWTSNIASVPVYSADIQMTDDDNSDIEMQVYDPPGGFYGIPGIPYSMWDSDENADPWQNMVLPGFSFEPNPWDYEVPAYFVGEQEVPEPVYEDIVVDVEQRVEITIPLRQRSERPAVEPSSVHLGPQIDWIKDSETLPSLESPMAASFIYDALPITPTLFQASIATATSPSTNKKRCRDSEDEEAVQRRPEVKRRKVATSIPTIAPHPLKRLIPPTSGKSRSVPRQSHAVSHLRPIRKLASAVGRAVNRFISHRPSWT
ncbi:hypothetical protein DXG01_006355 [Tephrocybe rancida]|nr:hypothetical protein DXG01_006355 [Tephrocybe rancida]